ncbi:GntR family transcriptional regulator [uncultured Algimonas sp.]|uniref:GntR family transcriptional regulator n=1 Tax=uncultured Algimonas sp. TaxID=1547920 RepID=UPI0026183150|nr:GntR family transcriptional regulator [uncultured Algimonas sp.]
MRLTDIGPDKSVSTPHYMQIAKKIRVCIENNEIEAGEALPSERELCQTTGVSRVTIRRALGVLEADKVVKRKHGAGTFVLPQVEHLGSSLKGFTSNAETKGHKSQAIWIVKAYGMPTADEATILQISETDKVVRLGRVRQFENEPVAIEHAVVPARLLPSIDEIDESLYHALESRGNRPVQGTQRVKASLANPTEAGLLSVREFSEVLRIERRSFLKDGTPVELTRSAYRGDRYDIVMDLGNDQLS